MLYYFYENKVRKNSDEKVDTMLQIAVCDDEKYLCRSLAVMIEEYGEKKCLEIKTDVYYSIGELFSSVKMGKMYQLIFLDIVFSEESQNGVEFAKYIRGEMGNEKTLLIFMSGYSEYYRELLEVRPMHFLDKPFTREQVERDLEKALELMGEEDKFFSYTKNHVRQRLPIKDIIYFESVKRQIHIKYEGGDDWFYGKLSDVTESLKDEKFCIPGDSYFVNYDKITRFSKRKIWLSNGEEINITRKHSQAMSDYRLKYE